MNVLQNTLVIDPLQEEIFNQLIAMGWSEDEARLAVEENVEPGQTKKFEVTDLSSANWVLKKIAEADKSMRNIEAMFNAEINELQEKKNKLLKKHANTINYFYAAYQEQLEDFAKAELEGKKEKSVKTLHGSFGFRKQAEKFIIDNDELAISFFELEVPEAIVVKKSILVSKIPKEYKVDSDFAYVEPSTEKFYIKAEI